MGSIATHARARTNHQLPRATVRVYRHGAICSDTDMRTFQLPTVTEIRRPRPIEPDTW